METTVSKIATEKQQPERYGQVYETTKRTADKRTTVIELRHSKKVSFDLKQIEVKTSHHFKKRGDTEKPNE